MSWIQFLKSKSFFKQVAISIVGLFLFVFILQYGLSFTTNHNQKIQVPDLNKLSLQEASKVLKELKLEFIVIDSTRYNPSYPNKSVIEQTPEAGSFVKEKRKIYLTLNPSKFRDVIIPDLNGRTKRQATTQLQSLGFIVGNFYYIPDIGKDVVRGLKHKNLVLRPGTKLPKNSVIDMILGDGESQ